MLLVKLNKKLASFIKNITGPGPDPSRPSPTGPDQSGVHYIKLINLVSRLEFVNYKFLTLIKVEIFLKLGVA